MLKGGSSLKDWICRMASYRGLERGISETSPPADYPAARGKGAQLCFSGCEVLHRPKLPQQEV